MLFTKEVVMVLPCHTEEGCLATCCSVFAPWTRSDLNRIKVKFPDLLEKKGVKVVGLIHARVNMYFLLPDHSIFSSCEDFISAEEFNHYAKQNKREGGGKIHQCVFLSGNRCSIYEWRPQICKDYASDEPCPMALASPDAILDYLTGA